ncbi:MAG: hypothetical protein QOD06_581 [Candidatus Binatota bacterium]|nr:hypothetical protein [Candidatus Binatota bacterium]
MAADLADTGPDALSIRLTKFLREQSGADSATVGSLRRLPGGASREIWAFAAELRRGDAIDRHELVVRIDPRGRQLPAGGSAEEFALLEAAAAAGVPVPRVHWLARDSSVLGAPFFVMDLVPGETLARRLLRDPQYGEARRVMARQLGEIVARVHSIDPAPLAFLPRPESGRSPAESELDRYLTLYDTIATEPHPVFELAFRWCRAHLPLAGRVTLVHGDYRVGNVVFGPEGMRAVLDWEIAHVGDPMEDLGWVCVRAWRFGADEKPVGGIGDRSEFFAGYERVAGISVDPARVHYWEVFGNLKWAIICISQARRHLDGEVVSVELASIGRRAAETEIELLDLIEKG